MCLCRKEIFLNPQSQIRTAIDKVVWNGPYARFLYKGLVMVGIRSRRAWARLGEVKETTSKVLKYGKTHPLAGPEWYIRSKSKNRGKWVKLTKGWFKHG